MADNLDKIVAEYESRAGWLRQMFATKQSLILLAVWTVAVFLLGWVLG